MSRKREEPQHEVNLPAFRVARTPISNAQYALFVQASGHPLPRSWGAGCPPLGREAHPVVFVTWRDALAYCEWLSSVIGKQVTLPSEAQWEKAASWAGRLGEGESQVYPWGETFEAMRCNCAALSLGTTTPVGVFQEGASPCGALDLAGNVWEWTSSLHAPYPFDPDDGRQDLQASGDRALRGGSWVSREVDVRCSARGRMDPLELDADVGFRVVVERGMVDERPKTKDDER
jgi:formylglycine-generating enzyme required for sulfatase activity